MSLREPQAEAAEGVEVVSIPCGWCIGCRVRKARDWAVRCSLEAAAHDEGAFVTLTYDDTHLPPSGLLDKTHLSGWLKRVRARIHPRRVRFFASGEYGETTRRPHYHALLFGLRDDPSLQEAWTKGFVRVDPMTPASVSYVAGYVGKKVGDPEYRPRMDYVWFRKSESHLPRSKRERFQFFEDGDPVLCVSERTAELVPVTELWRSLELVRDPHAPFLLMSRRPGIGGWARDHWRQWAETAIWNGNSVPAPRYLHHAFKLKASEEEYEALRQRKRAAIAERIQRDPRFPQERERAGEAVALSQMATNNLKRNKL